MRQQRSHHIGVPVADGHRQCMKRVEARKDFESWEQFLRPGKWMSRKTNILSTSLAIGGSYFEHLGYDVYG